MIAGNASAITDNAAAIAENTRRIIALEKGLLDTKSEITNAYKDAIKVAIDELDGKLTDEVAERVLEINGRITDEVNAINDAMEALTKRVKTLEDEVAAIKTKMSGYDTSIKDLGDRITTVTEQITAINTTIENLQKTNEELKEYIKNIQAPSEELKESIAATDKKIDEVKAALDKAIEDAKASDSAMKEELVKSIYDAKADVVSQLTSLRTEMTEKLTLLNETVTTLETKSKEIESKVTELRTFVTEQITSTKDWASATFVTLEEYSKVVSDVTSIKETIANLTNSLSEMETKLMTQWKSDIETAIAPVRKQIEDAITSITNEYTNAISAAKSEVTEAYRAEMKVEISKLEESLKAWVNSRFDSYWTIAETQAKLDAQKSDLEAQLKSQKEYLEGLINNLKPGSSESENRTLIDKLTKELETVKKTASDNAAAIETLRSDLSKATEDITKAYKEAITSAINEYDGTITGKIDSKITELNSAINTKISEINTRIDALDARVKTLEDSLSTIKSQISALQDEINALKDKLSNIIGRMVSISHIPTYADGIENVSYTMSGTTITPGSFTLRFEIQPASLAEDLAANWNTALSVKAVYTMTRASAGDFAPLTIESATASDGILSVTVSASGLDDAFFQGELTARARLKISDGTKEVLSEYIPLKKSNGTPSDIDYIDRYGTNFGPGVEIDGTIWAPVNCGSKVNEDGEYRYNEYGDHYSYEDMKTKTTCPNGWRIPTSNEVNTLIENYSEFTTYKKMQGYWFSGTTPYSENTPAVFLPLAGAPQYDKDGHLTSGYASAIYWFVSRYSFTGPFFDGVTVLIFKTSETPHTQSLGSNDFFASLRCVKE